VLDFYKSLRSPGEMNVKNVLRLPSEVLHLPHGIIIMSKMMKIKKDDSFTK